MLYVVFENNILYCFAYEYVSGGGGGGLQFQQIQEC